jgi:hypothetical protein
MTQWDGQFQYRTIKTSYRIVDNRVRKYMGLFINCKSSLDRGSHAWMERKEREARGGRMAQEGSGA